MRPSADEKWFYVFQPISDSNKYWPYKGRPVSFATAAVECEFITNKSTRKATQCGSRASCMYYIRQLLCTSVDQPL